MTNLGSNSRHETPVLLSPTFDIVGEGVQRVGVKPLPHSPALGFPRRVRSNFLGHLAPAEAERLEHPSFPCERQILGEVEDGFVTLVFQIRTRLSIVRLGASTTGPAGGAYIELKRENKARFDKADVA